MGPASPHLTLPLPHLTLPLPHLTLPLPHLTLPCLSCPVMWIDSDAIVTDMDKKVGYQLETGLNATITGVSADRGYPRHGPD